MNTAINLRRLPSAFSALAIFPIAALLWCLTFHPTTVQAAAEHILVGRIVGVHDGDTLTLLTAEKRQVRIRLAAIDTPESGQPYGSKSKQELSALCFGKTAAASPVGENETLINAVYLPACPILHNQYTADLRRRLFDASRLNCPKP